MSFSVNLCYSCTALSNDPAAPVFVWAIQEMTQQLTQHHETSFPHPHGVGFQSWLRFVTFFMFCVKSIGSNPRFFVRPPRMGGKTTPTRPGWTGRRACGSSGFRGDDTPPSRIVSPRRKSWVRGSSPRMTVKLVDRPRQIPEKRRESFKSRDFALELRPHLQGILSEL